MPQAEKMCSLWCATAEERAARVVAGDQQHAAVLRGAGVVGVLEDVAAAVDARALAVPHRKYAVELRLGEQVQLLRAPDRGGGDVLVDAGLEGDVVLLEEGAARVQRGVQPAQRRAAIAGHVAGGMQAGGAVEFVLQHGQAGQRLHAGEEDPAVFEPVFVVEATLASVIWASLSCCCGALLAGGFRHTCDPSRIALQRNGDGAVRELWVVVHHQCAVAGRDAVRGGHAATSAAGRPARSAARRLKRAASFGARPGVLQGQTAMQMPQP
jgi:hypothetical protein